MKKIQKEKKRLKFDRKNIYKIYSILVILTLTILIVLNVRIKTISYDYGSIKYDRNINYDEADNIFNYFYINNPLPDIENVNLKIFQQKTRKLLLFSCEYNLNFQIPPSFIDKLLNLKDEEKNNITKQCIDVSAYISTEIFHREPVNINLCDNDWQIIQKIDGVDFFKNMIKYKNGGRFFYSNYVSKEVSEKVYEWYGNKFGFNSNDRNQILPVDIFLNKNIDTFQIRSPVEEDVANGEQYKEYFKNILSAISKNVLKDAKVELYLCNKYLKTYSVIK